MADAVNSQTIIDADRNAVMVFYNISDGTGETAVDKVAPASLATSKGQACTGVILQRVKFSTVGMQVRLFWDATSDVPLLMLPANYAGEFDFTAFGGLTNYSGAGKTGKIQLSTVGHASGTTYSLVLELRKLYAAFPAG